MPEYGSPLPKTAAVRGIQIERAPLGKMLLALEKLRGLPVELVQACFPGKTPEQIRAGGSLPTVADWVMAALQTAPRFIIDAVSELTGVPAQTLTDDPSIGLDGILEIVDAWIEVNNILNFTWAVRALAGAARGMDAGSINSSRPASGSESESGSCLRITSLTRLTESLRSTRGSPTPSARTAS